MRLRYYLLSFFLFIGCMVTSGSAYAVEKVTYLTESFPPYVIVEDGKARGLSIDIFKAVFKAIGVEEYPDVEVVPWARAYNEALVAPNTCTFMMVRTPERESLFNWAGPILEFRLAYASKVGTVSIKTREDAWKYTVGVVRADSAHSALLRAGHPKEMIELSPSIKEIVTKVAYGRIDLLVADERITAHQIKAIGADTDDFETNFFLEKQVGYFAFNKMVPDETVQKMQKGIDIIRANGELERILGQYSLH